MVIWLHCIARHLHFTEKLVVLCMGTVREKKLTDLGRRTTLGEELVP